VQNTVNVFVDLENSIQVSRSSVKIDQQIIRIKVVFAVVFAVVFVMEQSRSHSSREQIGVVLKQIPAAHRKWSNAQRISVALPGYARFDF